MEWKIVPECSDHGNKRRLHSSEKRELRRMMCVSGEKF